MRWIASSALGLLVLSAAALAGPTEAELGARAADLRSDDRAARVAAARFLASQPSLPGSLAEPAIDYIKAGIVRSAEHPPRPEATASGGPAGPDDPDAATLAQIRARPEKYIGARFVLTGDLEVGNYYGYGYTSLSKSYYSLTYRPRGGGDGADLRRRLYLLKFLGRDLVEQVSRADQGRLLVRIRCTIDPERCDKPEDAASSITITDWQFLARGGKSWTPWAFEEIDAGFDILLRTGTGAIPKCIDLIAAERVYRNESTDRALRAWTILRLLGLPEAQRERILRELPERASRASSARAKVWATRAFNSLTVKRLLL